MVFIFLVLIGLTVYRIIFRSSLVILDIKNLKKRITGPKT